MGCPMGPDRVPDEVLEERDGVPNGARGSARWVLDELDGVPNGARRSARREPCHWPRHF
jgi:hypothetical protein